MKPNTRINIKTCRNFILISLTMIATFASSHEIIKIHKEDDAIVVEWKNRPPLTNFRFEYGLWNTGKMEWEWFEFFTDDNGLGGIYKTYFPTEQFYTNVPNHKVFNTNEAVLFRFVEID